MKRVVTISGLLGLLFWAATFAQTLDKGDLAQAVKRTIILEQGLEQWQDLPQYPLTLSNANEPTPVTFSGYYSVAWDDANLYVLGVFNQPQKTLKADLPSDAPEWWTGDTLELFVRPVSGQDKLHFAMNPNGTPFTALTSSVNYRTVSYLEETRWIVEVALPLGDVLPAVKVGDVWRFKVGRGYVGANEYSLWPNGGDFQGETNFGSLYFTTTLEDPETLYTRLAPSLE
jgi:Carbohydrate family 9 binding domain-like